MLYLYTINIHKSLLGTGIGLFLTLALINTNLYPASAHKIKTDNEVGATLHIEPNDNPRAGEPAKTWFALTRKGGKVIRLSECDCKLKIYKEPLKPESSPVLQPVLSPVSAEKYEGIPGTEVLFPQAGAYKIKLSGSPITAGSFQPFELVFPVTVAVGKKVVKNTSSSEIITKEAGTAEETQGTAFAFPVWGIGLSVMAVLGLSFTALQRMKRE